ncbi:hypothetical protein [Sandaracinus amylolyticus]|uniref:Uncharacterized protein n=1 Tax=Sandaracinus amylolyticus TaxID=927083 RepID=A0A0F6YHG3_9BACT|nr:hypothetical protein [Sandaracinus amylolyticus]AKF04651.1 hypothetical protein DB32_001800 [Sandaracinus amylolyticus]
MATKKKTTAKKTAKKSAKAAKRTAPAKKRTKIVVNPLSSEQRRSLLRVPAGYSDAVSDTIEAWNDNRTVLKLANRTPAQLASMLRKAEQAAEKERAFQQKAEEQLRALTDARMLAEHEVWSTTLALYGVAKAQMRTAPELAGAFEHMSELFARESKKPSEPTPSE